MKSMIINHSITPRWWLVSELENGQGVAIVNSKAPTDHNKANGDIALPLPRQSHSETASFGVLDVARGVLTTGANTVFGFRVHLVELIVDRLPS